MHRKKCTVGLRYINSSQSGNYEAYTLRDHRRRLYRSITRLYVVRITCVTTVGLYKAGQFLYIADCGTLCGTAGRAGPMPLEQSRSPAAPPRPAFSTDPLYVFFVNDK